MSGVPHVWIVWCNLRDRNERSFHHCCRYHLPYDHYYNCRRLSMIATSSFLRFDQDRLRWHEMTEVGILTLCLFVRTIIVLCVGRKTRRINSEQETGVRKLVRPFWEEEEDSGVNPGVSCFGLVVKMRDLFPTPPSEVGVRGYGRGREDLPWP